MAGAMDLKLGGVTRQGIRRQPPPLQLAAALLAAKLRAGRGDWSGERETVRCVTIGR